MGCSSSAKLIGIDCLDSVLLSPEETPDCSAAVQEQRESSSGGAIPFQLINCDISIRLVLSFFSNFDRQFTGMNTIYVAPVVLKFFSLQQNDHLFKWQPFHGKLGDISFAQWHVMQINCGNGKQ